MKSQGIGEMVVEQKLRTRRQIWRARYRHALAWALAASLPIVVYATYAGLGALSLGWAAHALATGGVALAATLPLANRLSSTRAGDSEDNTVHVRIGSDGLAVDETFVSWSMFRNVVIVKDKLVVWYSPSQRVDLPRPKFPMELVEHIRGAKARYEAQPAPLSKADAETLLKAPRDDYRRANHATLLQAALNTRTAISVRAACARALAADARALSKFKFSLDALVCLQSRKLLQMELAGR